MSKDRYQCLYCGHVFDSYTWYKGAYLRDEEPGETPKCPKCSDKNTKPLKEEDRDVYGYNKV